MSYESIQQLLYPLGYLSQILFTLRFLVQLAYSEKSKKSVTPKLFWIISLCANFALWIHCSLQMQYPIALIQSANAVVSIRHLFIFSGRSKSLSIKQAGGYLFSAIGLTTLIFMLISLSFNQTSWIQTPQGSFLTPPKTIALSTHLFGLLFYIIFNSRIWLQWHQAEKHQSGQLTPLFWVISLVGAFGSCTYFYLTADPVNFIGPAFGCLIYLRNLQLVWKHS